MRSLFAKLSARKESNMSIRTDIQFAAHSLQRVHSRAEKVWIWLAWLLPRRLVYWAAIRLCVNATTGYYSKTETSALLFTDALKRWDKPL